VNRRAFLRLLTFGTAACCAGCGLSDGGGLERIPPEDVPYGLLDATPSAESSERTASAAPGRPRVFFLDDERLTGVAMSPTGRDPAAVLDQAVRALAAGPDEAAQARGLTTAIPPSLTLSVVSLDGTVATVDLGGEANGPAGQQNTLAIGQVVLTATSVTGVDAVAFTRNGVAIQAPVGDGALADRPLVPADFAALRRPLR